MDLIKKDIIEEVNENVNNKFRILDMRLDRLFQKLPNDPPKENTEKEVSTKNNQKEKDRVIEGEKSDENKDANDDQADESIIIEEPKTKKKTFAEATKSQNNRSKPNENVTNSTLNVCYVGNSMSNNLDIDVLEEGTGNKIDRFTAYTVDEDQDAKFKQKNFLRVVPQKLKGKAYNVLVLQGGGIEITNINTTVNPAQNIKHWEQKVFQSSEKLFKLAQQSIIENPGLKVVILKRLARYDPVNVDPTL